MNIFFNIGLGDQYVGNKYNNASYTSIVIINIVMVDRHILLPWTYQILFDSYDDHVLSQSSLCLKDTFSHFSITSVLLVFYFSFEFF